MKWLAILNHLSNHYPKQWQGMKHLHYSGLWRMRKDGMKAWTFWASSWYLTYILNKLIFSLHHQLGHGRHRESVGKKVISVVGLTIVFYLYLLFQPHSQNCSVLNKQSQRFFPPSLQLWYDQILNWNETYQIIFFSIIQLKKQLGSTMRQWMVSISTESSIKKGVRLSYWVRFKNIN